MKSEAIQNVEEVLEKYFPAVWSTEDITQLISEPRFERDEEAINSVINNPIREFVFRGGKRLRPVLFLMLVEGFGLDPKKYHQLVLLIELVHNGTLVIDDIQDDSLLRRGKPTLHKSLAMDIATNTGVAMHLLPLITLNQQSTDLSDQQRLRIFEVYSQEATRVYFGQAIDIHWHRRADGGVSVNQYLEMTRLKTGALIRVSARLACIIAEQSPAVEENLQLLAESAGIAFQIRDDVLDITADQEKFGKAFGNDITEGKISLPVILALEKLSAPKRQRLLDILKQHTRDTDVIAEAHQLIVETGATKQALAQASQLLDQAWEQARDSVPAGKCRQSLQELIESFIQRDH